jgi:hypothetical protein
MPLRNASVAQHTLDSGELASVLERRKTVA